VRLLDGSPPPFEPLPSAKRDDGGGEEELQDLIQTSQSAPSNSPVERDRSCRFRAVFEHGCSVETGLAGTREIMVPEDDIY